MVRKSAHFIPTTDGEESTLKNRRPRRKLTAHVGLPETRADWHANKPLNLASSACGRCWANTETQGHIVRLQYLRGVAVFGLAHPRLLGCKSLVQPPLQSS